MVGVCVYLDVPTRPGRPHVTKVSEREVFLLWEEPETDGNSYIHAYKVDWFRPGHHTLVTFTLHDFSRSMIFAVFDVLLIAYCISPLTFCINCIFTFIRLISILILMRTVSVLVAFVVMF